MADYNNTTFGNFTGNSTNNTDEVTTLEPRAPSIAEAILAALIVLIICSTLVNNFFVLFVFGKVPRLRTPGPMYFLVLLAITQFFGVIFSLVPSLVSVIMGGEWIMGNVFDDVSAYMANLCYHLTVHTLGIICFERYLRICRPLKHEEIFSETVTVIILFGIIFFDCVLAIFPLIGWGEYDYLPLEYQCRMSALGWQKQISHLHFTFVITLLIPLVFSVVCYALIVRRIREYRKIGTKPGAHASKAKGSDSYGDRVRRSEDKMKRKILRRKLKIPMSQKEEAQRKKEEREYRTASELSDSSSSEDEDDVPAGHRKYVRSRNLRRKTRYRRYEVAMARTIAWVWVVFFVCWFPYFVCKYVETYEVAPMPQAVMVITVLLTFVSGALYPVIYVANNRRLRLGFLETVKKRKKGSLDLEDDKLDGDEPFKMSKKEKKKIINNEVAKNEENETVTMTPIIESIEE